MTRWARRKNKEECEASSWSELKKKDETSTLSKKASEQLEQRRAARRERRKKAKPCFRCRQVGHQAADCPARKGSGALGICFKCGSTEHKIQDCTANVGKDEMPFATCFICKETGHLSSKCPDNPKGLYPEGGGCRFCGSVLHYRRDCPERAINQNKGASCKRFKLREDNEDIEAIQGSSDDDDVGDQPIKSKKKINKAKVVKF